LASVGRVARENPRGRQYLMLVALMRRGNPNEVAALTAAILIIAVRR
jgi:hypothetical protein